MQGHLADREYDISFGRAGLLVAASKLVIEARKYPDLYEAGFVAELGERLYLELTSYLASMMKNIELGGDEFLGSPMGFPAYSIRSLLGNSLIPKDLDDVLVEALDLLDRTSVPSEFGLAWPRKFNSHRLELLGSWCNGSGGFATTFALSSRLLDDEISHRLAVEAATHAYATRVQNAADMCCGYTGRAYSQLLIYQLSGKKKWLENAKQLAMMALEAFKSGCMEQRSLYKGHLGLAVLIGDLESPNYVRMPVIGV